MPEKRSLGAKPLARRYWALTPLAEEINGLNAFDQCWILINKTLADRAAAIMSRVFHGLATEMV